MVARKVVGNFKAIHKYISYNILYKKGGGTHTCVLIYRVIARATSGIDLIPIIGKLIVNQFTKNLTF